MTVTLTADNPAELDAWAIRWLTKRGHKVTTEGDWIAQGKFLASMGLTGEGFRRIRHRKGCPDFETREGPTGRLIDLKPTDELREFCRLHKGSGHPKGARKIERVIG